MRRKHKINIEQNPSNLEIISLAFYRIVSCRPSQGSY
ncbi:hypothetical protein CY0110_19037 [Crocosphaera chwakensis CCY0110]|uniref:Uncharacterized protein n=1 Tax=Crocosphaera chwakensis CCY0110 TaxID=391612 RepID=A3IJD9_9CHRO|nr:hypothetical protein CY0110_19037 [Crocosphaera chwakensis CCY0110]